MFANEIARGMQWLDQKRHNWWNRIDLDTLDVSSACKCVLGQEFEKNVNLFYLDGFDAARFAEKLSWQELISMGFTIPAMSYLEWGLEMEKFAQLTNEWKEAITLRREQELLLTKQQMTESKENQLALAN